MKVLKVLQLGEYGEINFIDIKTSKEYTFVMQFLDDKYSPKIGDEFYIHESLLNPSYEDYNEMYTFGDLDSKYGRAIKDENDVNLISIVQNKKRYDLKRVYG